MTYDIRAVLYASLLLTVSANSTYAQKKLPASNGLYFIENKGQITDQNGEARGDIQYALNAPGINVFIGNGQLHYQFNKLTVNYPNLTKQLQEDYVAHRTPDINTDKLATVETYRMDVTLAGANISSMPVMQEEQDYYENYFPADGPIAGVQAHTCTRIVFPNVYKGIDWVICIRNNKLEHEFVVGPGGNVGDIKLIYNGQSSLKINSDGSITAATPMGTITEHAPVCYTSSGNEVSASYRLQNNVLSYKANEIRDIIVDPVLEWGTYYGPDSNNTSSYAVTCNRFGGVFSCGLTYAPTTGNVATTGSYQATYGGGCDAFLVKFDSSGHRLWGTYYGGPGGDWGNDVALDTAGNIYLLGTTGSTSAIATTGAQQTTFGGGSWDAFLVKFNAAGSRLWATYAGGTGLDYPYSVVCDNQGDVYIAGSADSYTNIATAGSFKPTHGGGHDDFLIQYNTSTGLRLWGTYYGGDGDDLGAVICCDGVYLYIGGYTSSTTGIATPLTHQTIMSGPSDAFIAKFRQTGTRDWGTYFGGPTAESVGGIACDLTGGLYLLGATASDTGIATPGAFQTTRGGNEDAFLVSMNTDAGVVNWATYYGGPGTENVDQSRIACDYMGSVYITGITSSTSGIASATGAPQPAYGGGDDDGFLAKFDFMGGEWWSTYYGGNLHDEGRSVAFDGKCAYLCGETTSPNNIATAGSFQPTGSSGSFYYEGFLAKFIVTDTFPSTLNTKNIQETSADLNIVPNPNNGCFSLSGRVPANDGSATLIVTDMAGRMITEQQAVIYNGRIDRQVKLTGLPAGIYLVKVITQNSVSTLRFSME